jgi:hypothetical protein
MIIMLVLMILAILTLDANILLLIAMMKIGAQMILAMPLAVVSILHIIAMMMISALPILVTQNYKNVYTLL